ncbi:RagB/SusD family nutrient uptake outer membrane protein [Paraflavitalea sp. CAU 1676]|uniref:RagB/SusD family nutrient uptake outer membrane protein n=1 Tax=Paraflavitalea sp. CAU 1676 TaxID=3032598 RepID=UPI0023DC2603|nr:RagB/SusD family nutrient uptake outer membrane protein [Paraflavitalea sp. CAU 1676]MDF2186797.1 RagB/SusD family nutrient uptake outer membrane protein [Paraflavitalea sp. CAU 1676]
MKKYFSLHTTVLLAVTILLSACHKDLDLQPLNANTSEKQYSNLAGYKQVLAKVYGSYSLVSSNGVGVSDVNIAGITDAGTTDFLRSWWNLQELTTDEAICAWNDAILLSFHNLNWTSSNVFVNAAYARSLFQITVCNEFIRESADEKLTARGFKESDANTIRQFRAEARFLRAFQYWVLIDLFGNPPFVTEADPIGKYIPKQIKRADLFAYIESELKAIENDLAAPRQNEYARADRGAAWALLARLYLNAKVYTGNDRSTDAITYASKVIESGYALKSNYKTLFMSDNDKNNTEVILPIAFDATNSQNYGGTTFLICSAHGTNPADNQAFGIPSGGWLGNRSTKNLPLAFGDYSGNADKRALFGPGNLEVNDVVVFNDGLGVYKFNNITSAGTIPPSPNGVLCSVDFPLFRLAEMYLVYAESVLRGGTGGTQAKALEYFNALRTRGYGNNSGNVSAITLADVLNERSRELYWEGFRRTDLIRYGQFTSSSYLWPWKGGVKGGAGVDAHFALFPIPAAETIANPNLVQNPNY